jgi:hypothetical protein
MFVEPAKENDRVIPQEDKGPYTAIEADCMRIHALKNLKLSSF